MIDGRQLLHTEGIKVPLCRLTRKNLSRAFLIYEEEQRTLKAEVQQLQKDIQEANGKTVNITSFLKEVKKYTDFDELTPGILRDLIEKIVVHVPDKSSGHRRQWGDIYYTFVGKLAPSHEIVERQRKAA